MSKNSTLKLSKELKKEIETNYITVQDLAEISGRSSRGIQYYITRGDLPALKVDNRCGKYKYMISRNDAAEFLDNIDVEVPQGLVANSIEAECQEAILEFAELTEPKETFIARVKRYLLTLSLAVAGKI